MKQSRRKIVYYVKHKQLLFSITSLISFYFFVALIIMLLLCNHHVVGRKSIISEKQLLCSKEDSNKNDADIARLMSIGQFGRPFPENWDQVNAYCK